MSDGCARMPGKSLTDFRVKEMDRGTYLAVVAPDAGMQEKDSRRLPALVVFIDN